MPCTFNILIATIGRPTLQRMLDSLHQQLNNDDCLTIVFDGHTNMPSSFDISKFKCKVINYCEPTPLGFFGHGIRNKYASILEKRDFIMHADDDDTYIEDSFHKLRNMIIYDNLYITKMIFNNNLIIPRNNEIITNNIGTPNGIIPYNLNLLGEWKHFYGGDAEFYKTISQISKTIFLDLIIYRIRH